MRYIFLLLLIIASIGIFVAVIIPRYSTIKSTRSDIAAYNANLATAASLQRSRDALVAQYNNIQKSDLDNIKTLLPDSVDNIRLIIQLDSLATKNGLSSLRNVTYSTDQIPTPKTPAATVPSATGTVGAIAPVAPIAPTSGTVDPASAQRTYGQFVISFQTSGQYSNFLSFLSDLEQNLRLVDITDVAFLPNPDTTGTQTAATSITYKVSLKTYWLKQ